MAPKIREIESSDEFERLYMKYKKRKLIVIKFWATWCKPCKKIAPKYEELSEKYFENVLFTSVDADNEDCEKVKETYKISTLPTFIIIKDGNVISKITGTDEAKLRKVIESNIKDDEEVQEKKPKSKKKESKDEPPICEKCNKYKIH